MNKMKKNYLKPEIAVERLTTPLMLEGNSADSGDIVSKGESFFDDNEPKSNGSWSDEE